VGVNPHYGCRTLSKLTKIRKDLEKDIGEESEVEHSASGDVESGSHRTTEWWAQMKAKITTVDQQILRLMKRLDILRTDMQLGKAKDQAAVDLNIHWLMVELDTGYV
jgi:hypothetical protein